MCCRHFIAVLACFFSWACIDLPEIEQVSETSDAGAPDTPITDSGTPPDASTPDSGTLALTVTLTTSRAVTNSDVRVSASVSGGSPDEVELLADGMAVATLAPPYELRWSTGALAEGSHTLAVRATLGERRFTSESRPLIVDRTPPRMLSQTPLTGAQEVSVHQMVQATFSEPLEPLSVTAESVSLQSGAGVIAAEVTLTSEGTSLTIRPASPFPADTVVQVAFEGAMTDLAGNVIQAPLEPWKWKVPGFLPLGEPLSASPTESSQVRSSSLHVDGTGRPVVAWVGGTGVESPHGVRVTRWNGSGWEQLGGVFELPEGSSSSFCSLTSDANGRSIVVWHEGHSSGATSMHARRWNGVAWDGLADVPLRPQASAELAVAKGNKQGQIALAYLERYQDYQQVLVWRWDGTGWGMLGGGLKVNPSWIVSSIKLAIDSAGNPVVAWSESTATEIAAYMRRWNGSSWDAIAMPVQTFPGQLLIDDAGAPVLDVPVWNGTARSAQLRRWNGSAWATLSSSISLYPGATDSLVVALTLDAQGRLVALLGEPEVAGGDMVFYVRRWNAGEWNPVASLLRTTPGTKPVSGTLFVVDSAGQPILARSEAPEEEPGRHRVHVYTPNN